MRHKHHIIPKHMNGSNDKNNIIELTISEHAEAHRLLWIKFGKKADYMAWQMLSGRTISEETRIEVAKEGFNNFLKDKERVEIWKQKIREARKKQIITPEHKNAISDGLKLAYKEGRIKYKPIFKTYEERLDHYNKVKERMAIGRKNSLKWKASVSSEACKLKKISSDPRTQQVIINGVKYLSMNQAKKSGFSRLIILKELKKLKV